MWLIFVMIIACGFGYVVGYKEGHTDGRLGHASLLPWQRRAMEQDVRWITRPRGETTHEARQGGSTPGRMQGSLLLLHNG